MGLSCQSKSSRLVRSTRGRTRESPVRHMNYTLESRVLALLGPSQKEKLSQVHILWAHHSFHVSGHQR